MSYALSPPTSSLIPVGLPWRSALRRPVFGCLMLAAVFFLCTAPVKQTASLYNHAPWLNDPFDTVISFMMFFVPLIAAFCVPRVMLCRRAEPLPAARVLDVLRGCRLVLAGVGLTLLTEWVSVVLRENRAQWNGATWLQVGLLAVMSIATAWLLRDLRRLGLPRRAGAESGASPDWIADAVRFADHCSRLVGPLGRPVVRLLNWGDRRAVGAIRRHPVWTAAAACIVFGAGAGISQGIQESYRGEVTSLVSLLLAAGMFGLMVAAGSYLGLIRSNSPLTGARRRVVDAVVITCIGILVPLAMRDHLWWLIGSNSAAAGLTQLIELLGIFSVAIFATAYAAESVLRLHRDPEPSAD
jgi:hypothetical protein